MTTLRTLMALTLLLLVPVGGSAQVSCGDTIRKGQKVVLTGDLGPCDGVDAALIVDGGSLDLGGFTVSCADTDLDADVPQGVVLLGKKSKVMHGTVDGCSNGVGLAGKGKHLVQSVTVKNNADDGIDALPGADKCKFMDNVAMNNADDGIQIRSDKNKLVNNTSTGNSDDGFDLWETAGKNKLVGNTANSNTDEGILVLGDRNKLVNTTANTNGSYGIDLDGTKNKVVGGTATGNVTLDLIACAGDKVKNLAFTTASPDCQ